MQVKLGRHLKSRPARTPRLIKKRFNAANTGKLLKHYAARIKMCSEPPYLPTSAETLATKNSRLYHNTQRDAINGFLPITSHERKN